jgi:hypothetical protein
VLASALISRRLPAYLYSTREDLPFRGLLFCLNVIGANKVRSHSHFQREDIEYIAKTVAAVLDQRD